MRQSSSPGPPETAPRAEPARWPRRGWKVLLALALGGLVAGVLEVGWIIAGANFHAVIPGHVYRSAQFTPAHLRAVVERHGIRTVINLRGTSDDSDWYQAQRQCLEEIGVEQRDVNFSSYFLPSVRELQALVRALDECPRPMLLHCRRGADRTGLASGLATLLHGDADVPTARRQLSLRYGHLGFNNTHQVRRVFDLYETWLTTQGAEHRPELLREYVHVVYRPGHCWATIEPLEVPDRLPWGRPSLARFRVTNQSLEPWRFKQAPNAGVYLGFQLTKADWSEKKKGGAGWFDAVLQPGESIELAFALPAVREMGKYHLLVDMIDPRLGWFNALGSAKFERDLDVDRPPQDVMGWR